MPALCKYRQKHITKIKQDNRFCLQVYPKFENTTFMETTPKFENIMKCTKTPKSY